MPKDSYFSRSLARTRSAGGIVLGDGGAVALVRARGGNGAFLFPKGHIENGETDEQAARREIAEETGLTDLELIDDLGEFVRPLADYEKRGTVAKEIKMFLFAAPAHAKLMPTLEIEKARWVPFREVPEVLGSPHSGWFIKDRAWFSSVFERVREAIQRD